ncbi:hypothetical protein [Longimicrobium sp.]|uniref:hypothetical protein n=1 Tax=Longimicrobium sp. TaxID=2029185 RepID=UPI002F93C690
MYGSETERTTGRRTPRVFSKPSHRTGPSGWSSAAASQAAFSVLALPFRSDSAHRWNRRRPERGFAVRVMTPFRRLISFGGSTSYIR